MAWGGVGKTSVLNLVYNHYKKMSGVFDVVIWVTVSQNYQIEILQASIAQTLKLEGSTDKYRMKRELSPLLGNKKFLLIFDDMWHRIDLLNEVGVTFGDHNCSKVLMSSRNREVIGTMGARDGYCLGIQPLSTENGWVMFRRESFTKFGVVPMDNIEAIARKIASECQGLPLALSVVVAAVSLKITDEREWSCALNLMRNLDPSFRTSHNIIDEELYQRLRWSYNDLVDPNLKIFFLYCVVFPEDTTINVETLVEMWREKKSVATYVDVGNAYIDALVRRGLIEYVHKGFSEENVVRNLHHSYLYTLGSE